MQTHSVELAYGSEWCDWTLTVTPDTRRDDLPVVGEALPGGDVRYGDPVVAWVDDEPFVLIEEDIFPGIRAVAVCHPGDDFKPFGYRLERKDGNAWVVFEETFGPYDTAREACDAAKEAWDDVLFDIAEAVRKAHPPRWLAWDVARDIARNSGFYDQANDIAEAVFFRLYPDEPSDEKEA